MNKCPKCQSKIKIKDSSVFYCFNCKIYKEIDNKDKDYENVKALKVFSQKVCKEVFVLNHKAYDTQKKYTEKEEFLRIAETPCPKEINKDEFQDFLFHLALVNCLTSKEKSEILRRIMVEEMETKVIEELMVEMKIQYGFYQKHLQQDIPVEEVKKEKPKKRYIPPVRKSSIRPILEELGRNMNDLVKEGKIKKAIGREKEIEQLAETLLKRKKNNPVIIGEAGVGKTAVVEGFVYELVNGNVDDRLKNKTIIQIQTSLINSIEYAGELEVRVNDLLANLRAKNDTIIFFDEIHMLMGQGTTASKKFDVADMLKPALSTGELNVIGATTSTEYNNYIAKDSAFERRLQPLKIDELSKDSTREIAYEYVFDCNLYYNLEFNYDLANEVVDLSEKYIRSRRFPDKVLSLMEKLALRKSKGTEKTASRQDVLQLISDETGIQIPLHQGDHLSEKLGDLEGRLKAKVFGQNHAIESVCNVLKITKRNLSLHPEKPDGVFLFTGPTGTGKTYLAKCLVKELFGSKNHLLKLDMNEYTSSYDANRLLGAYTMNNKTQSPILTKFVMDYPSSVIVLDEIEKAHPLVTQLFMQVFDEGVITDFEGKKVYFSDVTIIMTSNAVIETPKQIGFGDNNVYDNNALMKDLNKKFGRRFPPEILARIDDIIMFNKLTPESITQILKTEILEVIQERYQEELKINLNFSESLVKHLAKIGYSEQYGARYLYRHFQQQVAVPLTDFIFSNKVAVDSTIEINYEASNITFLVLNSNL